MNISYKWLQRYIDFSLTAEELAAALTSLGLECDTVEEVETIRGGLRGIVIGKVLTCIEHPNSDHLHITTCDLGTGEPVQIVCGAPNVAAGQTVVVATVGTTLYDGEKEIKIKKSKIRGVESFGMICAEDEIGLGNSHDGIMVLTDDVTPGMPAAEYFKVESDYCLEVELTPNRVDGASHYGVARDLKAWLRRHDNADAEVMLPSVEEFKADVQEGAATVKIDDTCGCPRYSGVTVRGVKVAESPDWLKNLLLATGQRPINNIVDITNFILLGLGQPLHCFDLNKASGREIIVRTCTPGTKFVTLDGKEHELHEADLMVCDAEKPMAIAGVFGGLDSGVTDNTTDVFIESAWFNPSRVRKTARRHGLSTDASFRYERGTDPDITVYAAKLAALLIKELAGGEICGDVVDIYPDPVKPFAVELTQAYCDKLIGKQIPIEDIKSILRSLDIEITGEDEGGTLTLNVPRYRVDVQRPCDVVEEILRVYGYNNVGITDEMHATLSIRTLTDESYRLQELISCQLTGEGFREIMNNSLSAVSYYTDNEEYPLEHCIKLINPLSQDLSVMRQTLLYGGLESIAHNINRRATDLRFYEFGNVYSRRPDASITAERPLSPFSEGMRLGIWLTGNYVKPSWNVQARPATVFDLRAVVDGIFMRLGIPTGSLRIKQMSTPVYSAALSVDTRDGHHLATLGLLSKSCLRHFDISQDVCYAEIVWNEIMRITTRNTTLYSDLPRTQPVVRDLALLIDKSVSFAEVLDCVRASEKKLLRDVRLFDVYEGEHLPQGKKSYAITITMQDPDKTLHDKQIDAVMHKIITNLEKQLGATLR